MSKLAHSFDWSMEIIERQAAAEAGRDVEPVEEDWDDAAYYFGMIEADKRLNEETIKWL